MRALNAAQKRIIQAYALDKLERGQKGLFISAYTSLETLERLEGLNDYESLAADFERHYTDVIIAATSQHQV